ncbi:DUF397 domain-containing protein [Nocardiopsis metallicus]|uniref:DUF397 domain-containing protein n=1 Tax=Nocardiopsis metallicus TaxID=179819 RepID=A0A840WCY4_9ACTN|nr:DUF397 domain-containing protein [Nocardiopsis metallicus]MBB5489607.1 hypothetical protein [Nocardiopsis metallicus]
MNSALEFRKSSYSGHAQNCVEVAQIPTSFRSGAGESCVEAGPLLGGAAIRDSKHPGAGHLPFPKSEWASFLTTALK